MIIKYCNKCSGKPYTTDIELNVCPVCGSVLDVESVSEDELECRESLAVPTRSNSAPYDFENIPEDVNHNDGYDDNAESQSGHPSGVRYTGSKSFANKNVTTVRGRISQYSSTGNEDGNYRRLFFIRWYQAIVYRQRLEDVLHRFTVRVDDSGDGLGYQGYRDVPVNVHGTISGGLQLADNMEVEVSGKYDKGVLMASSINVVNNGCKSKVTFQRSIKAITYGILFGILLIFLCVLGANSTQGFWQGIGSFLKTWAVFAAILSVLYLITSFSRLGILFRIFRKKGVSFPLLGILLVSLALSFLFLYIFGSFAGFGSVVASWVYAAVPIIVIIIALFFLIKGMF